MNGPEAGATDPVAVSRFRPHGFPFPLNCHFTTGREGERGRRWLSKLHDPGGPDLALWNPITFGHSIGVFDDFGEQLPPGPGDLILSLSVPAGSWRLSLCFVNDHNYYEANRHYTIHVRDRQGRFLTGCDVEDFLTPVYKHFAVTGPIELTVHIHRDHSLNTLVSGIFLDPLSPAGVSGRLSGTLEQPLSVALASRPESSPGAAAGRSSPAWRPELRKRLSRSAIPGPAGSRPDFPASRQDLWRPFHAERRLGRSAALQREALSRGCDSYPVKGSPDRPLEEELLRLSLSLHATGDLGGALLVDQELVSRSFAHSPAAARHHAENLIGLYDHAGRRDLALKFFESYLNLIPIDRCGLVAPRRGRAVAERPHHV